MENYSFLLYTAGIIFLFVIGKTFTKSIKKIIKFGFNSMLGACFICMANFMGESFNFHIGLNWVTIFCTGILGIPGIILMYFLKFVG